MNLSQQNAKKVYYIAGGTINCISGNSYGDNMSINKCSDYCIKNNGAEFKILLKQK